MKTQRSIDLAQHIVKITHVNMAREFRGGERQTLALIGALKELPAADGSLQQSLIVRRGSKLHQAASAYPYLKVKAIRPSTFGIVAKTQHSDIVHVHEGRSVRAGAIAALLGRSFVLSRRITKQPKSFFLTRWAYQHADAILCVSKCVADVMSEYLGPSKVAIVPDCVRTLDRPIQPVSDNDRFIVGIVGELDIEKKGQDTLLEAAAQLWQEHPDIEFRIIGDGKDRELLEQRIRASPNVTLRGWCAEMGQQYSEMDLLVHPSLDEGLGSSLLEAMSFGVPVVATNVGGIPEVVTDNYNGRLVSPSSASSIAAAIRELRCNPTTLATLSGNALLTAAEFSAQRMAERSYQHYVRVITQNAT